MEILINHFKASEEINNYNYFDLVEYENFASSNLKTTFGQYIKEREYSTWQTVLIGCYDLVVAEKLHFLNVIDITDGLDVFLTMNVDDFTNYCYNDYIPKYKENFEDSSIYKMSLNEEMVNKVLNTNELIFCLDLYKSFSTKSIFSELYCSIEIDIPEIHLTSFKDNFLYCNKTDLEIMYKIIGNEYKEEFNKDMIKQFEPGISIIEIQY